MKRVIAFKRTCSMCRDIFIPWRINDSPPPLSPLPPTPAPSHASRRGKWEVHVFEAPFDTPNIQHDASAYSKKLLERGPMINEYRWCCSIIPIQDCLKVAWRQMSPQRFTRQGKIIRRCKQLRSSAKLIYTSYPPSFSTIHLKWFQITIKYSRPLFSSRGSKK